MKVENNYHPESFFALRDSFVCCLFIFPFSPFVSVMNVSSRALCASRVFVLGIICGATFLSVRIMKCFLCSALGLTPQGLYSLFPFGVETSFRILDVN